MNDAHNITAVVDPLLGDHTPKDKNSGPVLLSKRQGIRYRIDASSSVPVSIKIGNEDMLGTMLNVGQNGFCMISRDKFPEFWLPGQQGVGEFKIEKLSFNGEGVLREIKRTQKDQSLLRFQFTQPIGTGFWQQAVHFIVNKKNAGAIWIAANGGALHISGTLLDSFAPEFELAIAEYPELWFLDLSECTAIQDNIAAKLLDAIRDRFHRFEASEHIMEWLQQQGIPNPSSHSE